MNNILKTVAAGYILLMAICLPLQGFAQKLIVSGKGQVVNAAYCLPAKWNVDYLFINDVESFVLPKVKPGTKEIEIVIDEKTVNFGRLEDEGRSSIVTMKYDISGNLVEIIRDGHLIGSYQYENGRVIVWSNGDLENRFTYDNNGFLDQQYLHNRHMAFQFFYKYKTDAKGNVVSAKKYYPNGEIVKDADETYQYDSKGRLITYRSHFSETDYFGGHSFSSTENRWDWDGKGNMVSLRVKNNVNGRITDYEYRFEYDSDCNPIRLVEYNHSDIMVMTDGWEYKYRYTYYLDPEEQRIQDSIQKAEDSVFLELQKEAERFMQEVKKSQNLKKKYMPCRFLFDSEEDFVSCISKDNIDVEKEMCQLIVKQMQYVSSVILSGKELRKANQAGKSELLQICDMCIQLKSSMSQYDTSEKESLEYIYNYTESVLEGFVTGRSVLNKAYRETSNTNYSLFLSSFIND